METQSQSGTATLWAARAGLALAAVGLVMEVVSGWGYRHGWWGLRAALRYLFAYGGVVAIVGSVVALVALALAIGMKSRGAALALVGVIVGAVPGALFYHQYRLAHRTALGMSGWEVTGSDSASGRIEATATTKWFGFKDDVVIRVAPRGSDSAVVDMRSKSRVGRSDVGANAARIRDYFAALRAAGR